MESKEELRAQIYKHIWDDVLHHGTTLATLPPFTMWRQCSTLMDIHMDVFKTVSGPMLTAHMFLGHYLLGKENG